MIFNPGESIGSYRIVRPLGRGGMSEVYEAVAPDGKAVAVKVFSVRRADADFLRKRFLAEGRILSCLDHPNLVHVYEVGVDPESETPYLVMELVLSADGSAQTLADVQKADGVTAEKAERWYGQLCAALRACHARGIVHRDVKLNNVLVDAEGHAILSDFGVSRVFDPELRDELQVTTTFVEGETTGTRPVMGTFWYLAPEVRQGGEAMPASDWYALGVLFFRLLTGLWYEANTNAFDLLAPYDKVWTTRLRRLLSVDPAARNPVEQPVSRKDRFRTASRIVVLTALLVPALGLLVYSTLRQPSPSTSASASPQPQPSTSTTLSSTSLSSTSFTLHYCKGVDFIFLPCPAGTNSIGKTAVAVTKDYWLGKVPVTWRQWRAVRGEPWEGGWNGRGGAPATYLTQDEAAAFCAKLTRRFKKELPEGYEIRLPTVAEWRLAYQVGETVTNAPGLSKNDLRRENVKIGWFGQGGRGSNMGRYFDGRHLPPSMVTNVWPEFPPRRIDSKDANWVREASQIASVPVGLKPANKLGLHDMIGNCFEMTADRGVLNTNRWGASEFGLRAGNPYEGQGLAVTNPVVRTGTCPLMLGTYLAPDLKGDDVWLAPFDRLPHLGVRLCIGPKLE